MRFWHRYLWKMNIKIKNLQICKPQGRFFRYKRPYHEIIELQSFTSEALLKPGRLGLREEFAENIGE